MALTLPVPKIPFYIPITKARAYLKVHSNVLYAPLCAIFDTSFMGVTCYADMRLYNKSINSILILENIDNYDK